MYPFKRTLFRCLLKILSESVSNEEYLVAGMNASFGGNNVVIEGNTISQLLDDGAFVVQAVPNVGQNGIPWGDYYSNVINVGAWNVDQNGYALAANPTSIDAIDIYADGYVSNISWGENFGTSFASPRVFAEIINYYNENLSPLINNGDIVIDPNATVTNEEITKSLTPLWK